MVFYQSVRTVLRRRTGENGDWLQSA